MPFANARVLAASAPPLAGAGPHALGDVECALDFAPPGSAREGWAGSASAVVCCVSRALEPVALAVRSAAKMGTRIDIDMSIIV